VSPAQEKGAAQDEAFAFDRTASRLKDMRSEEYKSKAHRCPHPKSSSMNPRDINNDPTILRSNLCTPNTEQQTLNRSPPTTSVDGDTGSGEAPLAELRDTTLSPDDVDVIWRRYATTEHGQLGR
jgi:hypothetical protein